MIKEPETQTDETEVAIEMVGEEFQLPVFDEAAFERAAKRWIASGVLHRLGLGGISGAIKTVERSLPELASLIKEECLK